MRFLLAVEADKAKAPALLGPVILGDVDIADPAILLEQTLEVLNGAPVAEPVHLEADHLCDVRRRATSSATTIISAGHLGFEIRL